MTTDTFPYNTPVELTVDLTRYHPKLVVGARGRGLPFGVGGFWVRARDTFVGVDFGPGIGQWDIVIKSLKRVTD